MEKRSHTSSHAYYAQRTTKKPTKWGRYIFGALLIVAAVSMLGKHTVTPPTTLQIEQGDTIQGFLKPLSGIERFWTKWYLRNHDVDTRKLQTGVYVFSGSYTPASYIAAIMAGPPKDYTRITVLEGWSIYDVDAMMVKKLSTKPGAFLSLVQDAAYIAELSQTFPFLSQDTPLSSLEGFLYPDTYFLGKDSDPLKQLVVASLKRFEEKNMTLRRSEGAAFGAALSKQGVKLSLPGALALASVIEKEERNDKQKPMIAGIFVNRLAQGMQLGADITICYGYQEPYETCTPSRIIAGLRDTANIYNTRVHTGLPPTPISSVSDQTRASLLRFQQTDNIFYLHDAQGGIHYAKTNAEHEQNKAQYLQ